MKRLNSLLHFILVCLIFTPASAQGKRSLDEIDSECFQANSSPFDKICVSVNLDEKRAKNIALVEHLDAGIGRVIDALKESGQYENTIIIFSSDNGGHLPSGASNGKLRGGKLDMYEGGIKVPTCMVWEGTIKPGSVSNKLGLIMDFYPTICSLTGISVLHTIDGIELLPGLLGKSSEDEDDRMVYFMRRDGGNCGGLCYYAARKGVYKLVQNTPFEEMQLFNIEIDPQEKMPLNVNCEQFEELKFGLSQHIRNVGAIPWQKDEAKIYTIH